MLSQTNSTSEKTLKRFNQSIQIKVEVECTSNAYQYVKKAKKEFSASASLKKYEWFKDASETIYEKKNTIKIYESNLVDLKLQYKNTPRKDWDRIDKQQYNLWSAEITGVKASYNKVVKEYNAQSSKFNWSLYQTKDEIPHSYDLYLDN